jgi:CDP-4-dehydro-6-deoxyglucose reductase
MPKLLTLSRAARLIGVRRGALQGKIRNGELAAFEGMVSAEDLQRAYPQAHLEDDSGLERLDRIKDAAYAQRMRERLMPSADALAARIISMSREREQVEAQFEHYRAIVGEVQTKLREAGGSASPQAAVAGVLAWLDQQLEPGTHRAEPRPLRMREDFLRIMTAHVQIKPSGHEYFVDGNDDLLEAALRAGLALDYGCSAGSCGKCKAKVLSGEVQRIRHSDYALTAAERDAGVILMCCNTAVLDLVIEAREAHGAADMPLQSIEAKVKSVDQVSEDMRLLHLQTPRRSRLRFLAGQSVTLELADGSIAHCPVASCPCDDRNLHFHVRRQAGEPFAERVFDGLSRTDAVRVVGPQGTFVLDEESHRPLVFIAGGTGFAPIKSLIEHAMALEVAETLHLFWAASGKGGHYLGNLCRSWDDALDDFHYVPLLVDDLGSQAAVEGVLQAALKANPNLDGSDFYVSGPAAFSGAVGRVLLEHGLPRAQLFIDAATD